MARQHPPDVDSVEQNVDHNNIQNPDGGTGGEYYHFTSAQHTDLTDAGDSTLHYHATDRTRSNHTGTLTLAQTNAAISDATVLDQDDVTIHAWAYNA